MRRSGILFPISSISSRFGIGCFSKEAYDFIDFLAQAGQSLWQVLPFGPTGFGDSPYQSFSAFAGNPYFVDPVTMIGEGLLTWQEAESLSWGSEETKVDYGAIFNNRPKILRIAAGRFYEKIGSDPEGDEAKAYSAFLEKQADWLPDYALFMALKENFSGKSWQDWDAPYKERNAAALKEKREELKEEISVFEFTQYEFQKQLNHLRAYAKKKNVKIIGDLPYYVSMDSADAWSHPENFDFDKDARPVTVAGCPPDAFSPTGQLWGNPVYRWNDMKKKKYSWWKRRLERTLEMCDIIRIDHFNGFESFYAVPADEKTAEKGAWKKGPGAHFFTEMKKEIPGLEIIAEDLGEITPATQKLLSDTGYPGMNVLEFAFDWSEYSYYMTFNHKKNSVVYTGTHDNMPVREWIESISDHDRDLARRFIHSENTDYGTFTWDFIREAFRSPADTCIIPLADYLVKGKEARINTPGTFGTNWQWRLEPNFLSEELAKSIYDLTKLYCRLPQPEKEKTEDKEQK